MLPVSAFAVSIYLPVTQPVRLILCTHEIVDLHVCAYLMFFIPLLLKCLCSAFKTWPLGILMWMFKWNVTTGVREQLYIIQRNLNGFLRYDTLYELPENELFFWDYVEKQLQDVSILTRQHLAPRWDPFLMGLETWVLQSPAGLLCGTAWSWLKRPLFYQAAIVSEPKRWNTSCSFQSLPSFASSEACKLSMTKILTILPCLTANSKSLKNRN